MLDLSIIKCYITGRKGNLQGGDIMPDMSSIMQIIGSLGFPITACVYLFYSLQKERERNEAQREADRLEHKQEMEKMTEALHNNTIVIQKLVDTLTAPVNTGSH